MRAQVALLRGINVGAHNRIPMADLRALLADIGYPDARTLVQSGNIVLSAELAPEELAAELERAIAGKFGVQTPVVVRTRDELAAVVALDPLGDVAEEHKLYQVSFLSAEPDPRGGGEDRAGRFRTGALRACGARDLRMASGRHPQLAARADAVRQAFGRRRDGEELEDDNEAAGDG